jgi:hypothetical protein
VDARAREATGRDEPGRPTNDSASAMDAAAITAASSTGGEVRTDRRRACPGRAG